MAVIVNKRVQNAVFGSNLKNDRMISLFPRQTIQYHSNPSLCPTTKAEAAQVEWFCDDLQDLLELTLQKDVLFITGDWNAKAESQEIPGVRGKSGLGVQNEAGQRLPEPCKQNTLAIADILFQHHKRRRCTWTSPTTNPEIRLIIVFADEDGELYTASKNKTRN